MQYFERARYEYHPEYKGKDAEVLIGQSSVSIPPPMTLETQLEGPRKRLECYYHTVVLTIG